MKKDIEEIKELDEKVKGRLENMKRKEELTQSDLNEVKGLKNNIFEKTSKVFIYNLKRLIQLESTQKLLAKKIGVSEDLLSKYKAGEAFPSIETLIYICEVYNLKLDRFISQPLTISELENLKQGSEYELDIFEEQYFVYFLVTNINKEGAIHEGIVEIHNQEAAFKIISNDDLVKAFEGSFRIKDKLMFFNLHSPSEGAAFIYMIKPNVNKNRYVGGTAMLMLPSDANSKPCVQKILFTKVRINREKHYRELKSLLNFSIEGREFGHIKISQAEDEISYSFIKKML